MATGLVSRSAAPYSDFRIDIARRAVLGHYSFSKHGRATASANDYQIWPVAGDYPYPTSSTTLYASSSSGNDTSDGTGVQTIQVFGNTFAGVPKLVTVTMAGTTGVAIDDIDFRVNRVRCSTVGTGGENAGDIYIGTEETPVSGIPAAGNTLAKVSAGRGSTEQLIYSVPDGYTAYVYSALFDAGRSANNSVEFDIYTRRNTRDDAGTLTIAPWAIVSGVSAIANETSIKFPFPLRVAENSDLEVRNSSAGTAEVQGLLNIVLVADVDAAVAAADLGT